MSGNKFNTKSKTKKYANTNSKVDDEVIVDTIVDANTTIDTNKISDVEIMSNPEVDSSMDDPMDNSMDNLMDNPIDKMMIELSDKIDPMFKYIGYTPNGLSIVSLIFAIGSLYSLYNYNVYQFAIYLILARLFDCMDDHYARKYDLVKNTDDKYDNCKNTLIAISIAYIAYCKYNVMSFPVLLMSVMLLVVLCMISVSCNSKLTRGNLNNNTMLNPINPHKKTCVKYAKYLKVFGPGTLVIVVILCILYLNSQLDSNRNNNGSEDGTGIMYIPTDNRIRDILDISRPFNGFCITSTNPFI